MTKRQKPTIRYSDCFKQMVVEDIEKKGLTIHQCNSNTASQVAQPSKIGLKKSEKNHLLNKIIRVETKNEASENQLLRKELKALKEAYAEAMLELKVH